MDSNTICAISTPPGAGAIGMVRLSGPDAITVAERLFRPRAKRSLRAAKGYTGMLGRIVDEQGDLDDAVAFVYRAPASYTGEDIVELSCHGGVYGVRSLFHLCLRNGAQAAAPGEFTKRAFLNGKLSLSDAEAVIDLVEAQGKTAMRVALAGRDGKLSVEIDSIAERLTAQSAHLAAWADYPEEEIETVRGGELAAELGGVLHRIEHLLDTWEQGKILREGVETVIVGRPNVGKSTLMNLLAGEERSIVTEIPGTTRDFVEESVRLKDCVLRLVDTAGIRDSQDLVEKIGVDRAKKRLESAGLVLLVLDSSQELQQEDLDLLGLLRQRPCIAVVNKMDLPQRLDMEALGTIPDVVTVSAQTGRGREALEEAVCRVLQLDRVDPAAPLVATERQRLCLIRAGESLREALEVLSSGCMLDAVAVSLDYALDELLSLTGRRASEAVVDEVFARFCVGK